MTRWKRRSRFRGPWVCSFWESTGTEHVCRPVAHVSMPNVGPNYCHPELDSGSAGTKSAVIRGLRSHSQLQ